MDQEIFIIGRGQRKTQFKTETSFCPTASQMKKLPAHPEINFRNLSAMPIGLD